jgi:hypothetical protein
LKKSNLKVHSYGKFKLLESDQKISFFSLKFMNINLEKKI